MTFIVTSIQILKSLSKVQTPRSVLTAILAASAFQGAAWAQSADFTMVTISPAPAGISAVLKEEAGKAEKLGRKPVVYFYADWCSSCILLRNSLPHPLMRDAFKGVYLIQLDADNWSSARLQRQTGFHFDSIPTLFAIDREGRPAGRITGDVWGTDIPQNMAPPLKVFFQTPLR